MSFLSESWNVISPCITLFLGRVQQVDFVFISRGEKEDVDREVDEVQMPIFIGIPTHYLKTVLKVFMRARYTEEGCV